MLALTRRKQERVFIGDNVIVTVMEIEGNKIRLGISAPRNVRIVREELMTEAEVAEVEAAIGEETTP